MTDSPRITRVRPADEPTEWGQRRYVLSTMRDGQTVGQDESDDVLFITDLYDEMSAAYGSGWTLSLYDRVAGRTMRFRGGGA